jgi:hypothetical protein
MAFVPGNSSSAAIPKKRPLVMQILIEGEPTESDRGRERPALTEADRAKIDAIAAQCSAQGAEWVWKHREHVLDDRKFAKMVAGHNDAIAEGLRPDSREYYHHVERHVGLRSRNEGHRENGGDDAQSEPRVTVLKKGEPPPPGTKNVRMTRAEYEAATQHLTWGHGPKKGQPIGVAEYIRRRQIQDKSPEWQRLD